MEFVVEKREVVQRYEEADNYLIASEDELKQLFNALEQQPYPPYYIDYKKFKEMVKNGDVYVTVIFNTYAYDKRFVLRVKGD